MRQRSSQRATAFVTLIVLLLPFDTLQAESIVLFATDFPPYEIEKPIDGLRGFDVEVIEEAFNRAQISTEFKFYPWNRALELTKRGVSTGIFSCSYRAEREGFLIYSNPISRQTDVFFVRSEFNGFEPASLKESKGLRVGTVLGYPLCQLAEVRGS